LKDFIVILPDEGQLESILGRIDRDGSRFGTSVKAVNDITLDSGQVDGLLEGLDNTVITTCQLRNRNSKWKLTPEVRHI
jgi:hypothetical protein